MADANNEQFILENLKKIGQSQKGTKASIPGTTGIRRPQGQTSELLNVLNTAKDVPVSAPTKKGKVVLSTEVKDLAGDGVDVLGKLLKPLETLAIPRNAIISTVREVVDILDSDPNTKGSWGDWFNQTKDTTYGFGKAFPMKGWLGRVVGFAGDVLLDPLTYATLGGTVAKGATFIDDAGKVQKTRSILGRTVTGREGRQKLANFAKERVEKLARDGHIAAGAMSKAEIQTMVRDIAAEGKKALPKFVAEDIGIRGPGVYYFGSRVKVPKSDAVGAMFERGLTKARLGVVNSDPIKPLIKAFTPKGVGRIGEFGPDFVRDARIALAGGRLDPEDADKTLTLLQIADNKRINVARYSSGTSDALADELDDVLETTQDMRLYIDNVVDPETVPGATFDDVVKAKRLREVLDNLQADVERRAIEVGATPPGYVKGFFPRVETEMATRRRNLLGEEAFDEMIYGPPVDSRVRSSFRRRTLKAGDEWFGHTLTPEQMDSATLNALARNPTQAWLSKTGQQAVDFDIFETDVAKVLNGYIRQYGEQMATYDMIEELTTRAPGMVAWMERTFELDPEYVRGALVNRPKEAFEDSTEALRNWSRTTNEAGEQLTATLEAMLGVLRGRKDALLRQQVLDEDLVAIVANLDEALKQEQAALQAVEQTFAAFDDMLENVDGLSNNTLVIAQRQKLADEYAGLARRVAEIQKKMSADWTAKPKEEILALVNDFADHARRIARFERQIDSLADVQDILPAFINAGEVNAGSLYDSMSRFVKLKGLPKDKPLAGNKSWTAATAQAVANLGNDGDVMNSLLAFSDEPFDIIGEKQMKNIARYVWARIASNDATFVTDFNNGIWNRGGKPTFAGLWKKAFDDISKGASSKATVRQFVDMLHGQIALSEYLQYKAVFDEYGLTIGDDVIDEILRRKAEPILAKAIRDNDVEMLERLTNPQNVYGRNETIGHPFSRYKMVERAREVRDDIVDEIHETNKINQAKRGPVDVSSDRTKELAKLKPKQRAAYKNFIRRQQVQLRTYRKELAQTKKDLDQIRGAQESIDSKYESVKRKVLIEFGDSGSKGTLKQRFDATVQRLFDDPTKIEEYVVKKIIDFFPKEIYGEDVGRLVAESWKSNYAEALRIAATKDSADNGNFIKEIIGKMLDGLGEEIDNAAQAAKSNLDLEVDEIAKQVSRITDKIILLEDNINNMSPSTFLRSEAGQQAYEDVLIRSEGVRRAVQPGTGDVPENIEPVEYLKQTLRDLVDSDQYPIAKAQQKSANIAYIVAELNGTSDIIPGIRFSNEEWDAIMSGAEVATATSRKLRAIVKHAENIFQQTDPDEFARLGGEVSEEYALKRFVQKTLTERPDVVAPTDVVQARRAAIQKAFEQTDGYQHLKKIEEFRARVIAADVRRKSINPQRKADALANANDEIDSAASQIAQDQDEWMPEASKEIDLIIDRLKRWKQDAQGRFVTKEQQISGRPTGAFLGYTEEGEDVASNLLKQIDETGSLRFTKGPERARPNRSAEEKSLEWLRELSYRNERTQGRIKEILGTPLERKTVQQLEDEIRLLEEIKKMDVEIPDLSVSRTLRERRRELARRGNLPEELDPKLGGQKLRKKVYKQPKNENMQNVYERTIMGQGEPKGEFDLDGGYGWADYAEEAETAARQSRWRTTNLEAKPADERLTQELLASPNRNLVPTELTPELRTPSSINDEGLRVLENDLRSVVRPSDVGAKQAELDRARAVVRGLEAQYDQAAAVINAGDPDALTNVQESLDLLEKTIQALKNNIEINKISSGDMSTISKRTGDIYGSLKMVQDRLQQARKVAEYIGDKKSIDLIDRIMLSQVEAERQFFETFAQFGQTKFDNQMLGAAEAMISSGAKLMEDGRIALPSGVIVDGVPPEMVAEAIRESRKTFAGWKELGNFYPELQGSPEFMQLWEAGSRMESPEWVRKLAYYVGPYTKAWKAFAVLSPGFHVRNAIANAVTYTLADGNMDNLITVTPIYTAWAKAKRAGISWAEFLRSSDVPQELVPALQTARLGMLGSGGGIFSETFKEATGGSRIYNNWLVKKNQAIGQAADNYMRFALAFDTAVKGGDVGLAQTRVKRFYFDYEDLSAVDEVMRQIVPFWLWTSRNLTMQIQNMWLNPRPYLIYESFKRNFADTETPFPPFVEEMGGFRLPFGTGMYLMPDLGFNRIGKDLQAFVDPMEFLNKANPLIKIPAEQAMGASAFTGTEFKTPQDRLAAILRAGVPPVGQGERLFGKEGLSQLNAWLGYLGSPVRKYN